jgi:hypothetical protein
MPSSFSESRSRANNYADERALVHRVIEAYMECVSLPRVSSFIITDEGFAKLQKTLQPGSLGCHFKCDVERVTERILKDAPALQRTWWAIAEGNPTKGLEEVHLVQKLRSAYRSLDPWKYFRPPLRRGSVLSQRRAA